MEPGKPMRQQGEPRTIWAQSPSQILARSEPMGYRGYGRGNRAAQQLERKTIQKELVNRTSGKANRPATALEGHILLQRGARGTKSPDCR